NRSLPENPSGLRLFQVCVVCFLGWYANEMYPKTFDFRARAGQIVNVPAKDFGGYYLRNFPRGTSFSKTTNLIFYDAKLPLPDRDSDAVIGPWGLRAAYRGGKSD